jgi:hypothetical protein
MWKTGHSLIKEKMKEGGAPVAGEMSGHICFAEDYYGFDDAMYGARALRSSSRRAAAAWPSGWRPHSRDYHPRRRSGWT